jgi:hypothetical protein
VGRGRWLLRFVLLAVLSGCGREPGPVDTGARDTARTYYEAVLARDWSRAYAALHSDTRKKWSEKQFAGLAQTYRQQLGFEPDHVQIGACEEQGTKAVAHVVWTGDLKQKKHRFKDAAVLQRSGGAWGIVLPPGFPNASGS